MQAAESEVFDVEAATGTVTGDAAVTAGDVVDVAAGSAEGGVISGGGVVPANAMNGAVIEIVMSSPRFKLFVILETETFVKGRRRTCFCSD
jgi:hypothetical protein